MQTVILIPCVKEKLALRAKASDMYVGDFFKSNLTKARSFNPDHIFILSGKYGLLRLEEEIDSYDVNLHDVGEEDLKAWSESVLQELSQLCDLHKDRFIIMVDEVYRRYLLPEFSHFEIL